MGTSIPKGPGVEVNLQHLIEGKDDRAARGLERQLGSEFTLKLMGCQ